MDDMERTILRALKKLVTQTRERYWALGMRNSSMLSGDEKIKAMEQYDQVTQEWLEAEKAYSEALRRVKNND